MFNLFDYICLHIQGLKNVRCKTINDVNIYDRGTIEVKMQAKYVLVAFV